MFYFHFLTGNQTLKVRKTWVGRWNEVKCETLHSAVSSCVPCKHCLLNFPIQVDCFRMRVLPTGRPVLRELGGRWYVHSNERPRHSWRCPHWRGTDPYQTLCLWEVGLRFLMGKIHPLDSLLLLFPKQNQSGIFKALLKSFLDSN